MRFRAPWGRTKTKASAPQVFGEARQESKASLAALSLDARQTLPVLPAIHGGVRARAEMSHAILRPENHAGDTDRGMSAGGASCELVLFLCHSIANVATSEL